MASMKSLKWALGGVFLSLTVVAAEPINQPQASCGGRDFRPIYRPRQLRAVNATVVHAELLRHLERVGLPLVSVVEDAALLLNGEGSRILEEKGFYYEHTAADGTNVLSSGWHPVRLGSNGQRVLLYPNGGVRLTTYTMELDNSQGFFQVIEVDSRGRVLVNSLEEVRGK